MSRRLLLAAAMTLCALASSVQSAQLYHRPGTLDPATAARPTAPNSWSVTAVAPVDAPHTVTIAMHFADLPRMQALFADMHDPNHPQWLNHLTRDEVHAIIAPPQRTTDRLLAWMSGERGVPAAHVQYLYGANAVRVDSTVGHINALFNTTLHEFTHTDGHTAYRQLGASYVPDEFAPLVHLVDGLAMLPYAMKKHVRVLEWGRRATSSGDDNRHDPAAAASSSSPSAAASPAQPELGVGLPGGCGYLPIVPTNSMYGLYNMSDLSSSGVGGNPATSTQTVQFYTAGANNKLQANSFSPADLRSYSQLWSQSSSGSALQVQTVTGPNDANAPTDEPTLDVQSITALNPLAANQFELTPGGGHHYGWAACFVSRDNISQLVSISYGIDESVFLLPAYANQPIDNLNGFRGLTLSTYLEATNNLVRHTAH